MSENSTEENREGHEERNPKQRSMEEIRRIESLIERRKRDHIDICLNKDVNSSHNYWNDLQLVHEPLPEIDMDEVDTGCNLFGKDLSAPIIIAAMTGGCATGEKINENLAKAAAEVGVGMGVGSQRAALEIPELSSTYSVVADHDVPLIIGNIGAPQLIQQEKAPLTPDDARAALEMIDADILAVHLNFVQEFSQPEGDHNSRGSLEAIGRLADEGIPVLAKETGAGIPGSTALKLAEAGVKGFDVGGLSGTSWSAVEVYRSQAVDDKLVERIGRTFWDWGIPTPVSVMQIRNAGIDLPVIATGGLSTGLDAARAMAMGATAAGYARALLEPALESAGAVKKALETIIMELKVAMVLTGSETPGQLGQVPVIKEGRIKNWM